MKLIHTSDIHIDSPLTAKLSPTAARERKRELVTSFRNTIDDAVRMGALGIIIAGDLFDSENVGRRTVDSILGIIENASDICFFYLPGNHEKNRIETAGLALPENLKIFGEDWTYYKVDNLTIAGRSRITPDMFSTLTLYDTDVNVVVLHGVLDGGADDERIPTKDIAQLPIDYLALGHYHSYSEMKISNRTSAVYCGTPEGRGFDETGEKGYVIIDVDGSFLDYRFVKHAQRTLHEVNVDISSHLREIEIENSVAEALSGIDRRDIVRVCLIGEREAELRVDTDSLTARFSSSYFYFEAKDKTRLKITPESYKNDLSLKGEFIRLVMAKEELTEDEKNAIIECGIRALAGETV